MGRLVREQLDGKLVRGGPLPGVEQTAGGVDHRLLPRRCGCATRVTLCDGKEKL